MFIFTLYQSLKVEVVVLNESLKAVSLSVHLFLNLYL